MTLANTNVRMKEYIYLPPLIYQHLFFNKASPTADIVGKSRTGSVSERSRGRGTSSFPASDRTAWFPSSDSTPRIHLQSYNVDLKRAFTYICTEYALNLMNTSA